MEVAGDVEQSGGLEQGRAEAAQDEGGIWEETLHSAG
jgi:hypothetical protein